MIQATGWTPIALLRAEWAAMFSPSRARRLLQAKQRRQSRLFLAEGPHVVGDALAAGVRLEALFVTARAFAGDEVAGLCDRARGGGTTVQEVDEATLATLAETLTPQGVVGVAPLQAVDTPDFGPAGAWLLLDGVQDPGNVGTLLRSAAAFGLRGVLAVKGTADPWSGKVVRSAQGAHFHLDVWAEQLGDVALASVLDGLAAAGGALWATDSRGDDVFATRDVPERLVVAVGNEARGLSEGVAARAARRIAVPQRGRADSLNVAMASSVVLAWIARGGGG